MPEERLELLEGFSLDANDGHVQLVLAAASDTSQALNFDDVAGRYAVKDGRRAIPLTLGSASASRALRTCPLNHRSALTKTTSVP